MATTREPTAAPLVDAEARRRMYRQLILECAEKVFAKSGYRAARIQDQNPGVCNAETEEAEARALAARERADAAQTDADEACRKAGEAQQAAEAARQEANTERGEADRAAETAESAEETAGTAESEATRLRAAATAAATGFTIPAPAAIRIRAANRTVSVGARPAIRLPPANTARPTAKTRRRPIAPVNDTSSGDSTV